MACLLHEKPFAGVNGSGKHVNWSLGNATQGNLLDPGETPHENAQFLVFCARRHPRGAQVRRACCAPWSPRPATTTAWAPTRRRRRSSRSSWAISSPTSSSRSRRAAPKSSKAKGTLTVGVDTLPPLPKDAGDRNRTSPFAFTGNRFEFRAVGSGPVDRRPAGGDEHDRRRVARLHRDASSRRRPPATPSKLNAAVQKLLDGDHQRSTARSSSTATATRRSGTPRPRSAACRTCKTAVDALPVLDEPRGRSSCSRSTACSRERELESRLEIYLEQYCKTVNVEARS